MRSLAIVVALLGLFSLVTLFAHALLQGQALVPRQAAWYTKELPTFADTIAFVREHLWPAEGFWMACEAGDMVNIPKALFERFTDALAMRPHLFQWIKSNEGSAPKYAHERPSLHGSGVRVPATKMTADPGVCVGHDAHVLPCRI